ncbi:hypothetical protein L1887_20004 [Cichorium endivia]|nr:hypothetical protein L1887_20004 [Cichorium endivia]
MDIDQPQQPHYPAPLYWRYHVTGKTAGGSENHALNGHRKREKKPSVPEASQAASQTLTWNSGSYRREKARKIREETRQRPRWRLGRWPRTPSVFGASRSGTLRVVKAEELHTASHRHLGRWSRTLPHRMP